MSARRPGRIAVGLLSLSLLAAWSGWLSGFRQSTTAAAASWSITLLVICLVDVSLWLRGRRAYAKPAATTSGARRGFVRHLLWLVLLLVVAAWEALGIDTGPRTPHLTISALALAYRAVDAALLLAWILVGLGYGAVRAQIAAGRRTDRPSVPPTSPGSTSPPALAGAFLVGGHGVGLLLPASRAAGVVFWICWVGACFAAELVARRSNGRLATAEELLAVLSGPPPARIFLAGAWGYAGWHLFVH